MKGPTFEDRSGLQLKRKKNHKEDLQDKEDPDKANLHKKEDELQQKEKMERRIKRINKEHGVSNDKKKKMKRAGE